MILAHLLGESWHIADLLLYGGAGLGLACGVGLFLWGRHERKVSSPPRLDDDVRHRPQSLIRHD